jgi:hypothetical protein
VGRKGRERNNKGIGFFCDLGWWGKKMRDDDEQKGLLWRLPKLETADFGKLGPGFGYGIGCGFGVGAGVIGGLFFGSSFPSLASFGFSVTLIKVLCDAFLFHTQIFFRVFVQGIASQEGLVGCCVFYLNSLRGGKGESHFFCCQVLSLVCASPVTCVNGTVL